MDALVRHEPVRAVVASTATPRPLRRWVSSVRELDGVIVIVLLTTLMIGGCAKGEQGGAQSGELLTEVEATGKALASVGQLATLVRAFGPHSNACRVVVVASSTCPFCRALAHNWLADMALATAERGTGALAMVWILAEVPGDTVISSVLARQAISLKILPAREGGDLRRAQEVSGIIGTPVSLLVDGSDTIRSVVGGNRLIDGAVLRQYCDAR